MSDITYSNMDDIALRISPPCNVKIFLSFLLNRFPLPALVALLLTRRLVACTNQELGSRQVRDGCPPMRSEEFIRHAGCNMHFRPRGTMYVVPTRALHSLHVPIPYSGLGVWHVPILYWERPRAVWRRAKRSVAKADEGGEAGQGDASELVAIPDMG